MILPPYVLPTILHPTAVSSNATGVASGGAAIVMKTVCSTSVN